jgi:hypothetical protein
VAPATTTLIWISSVGGPMTPLGLRGRRWWTSACHRARHT